jgi:hypothetical protein
VATAGAEAATAGAVVVSTAVAVSTEEVLAVGSTGEASAVAPFTAVVVSVGDVLAVALYTAVAFVVGVLLGGTGAATGAITDSLMMSSSVATVILGGGVGAIPTDITVTTITRTITMDTAATHTTTMDTADTATMIAVMDTAMAADQGISGVCGIGDKPRYGSLRSPARWRVDRIVSDVRDEAHLHARRATQGKYE